MGTEDAVFDSEGSGTLAGSEGIVTAVVLSTPVWLVILWLSGDVTLRSAIFTLLALLFPVLAMAFTRRIYS